MSQPNAQAERIQFMHDQVHDYIWEHCGVGDNGEETSLREEIDHPEKRSDLYELYEEYIDEIIS